MEPASIRVYINKNHIKLSTLIDYLPEYDCGYACGLLAFSEKTCKRYVINYIAQACTLNPEEKEFWFMLIK